ncbi:MAG: peptidase S41, partial [Oscillospiraceae bacterium]|nr:peptidase S41 [Oscillospiraceae bacterium]
NWATVVGTQTGGKSRTQVTVELSDGGALHISTLKYLSSKGVDLAEAGGVTPNVIAATDPEGKSDTQLAAALEAIKTLR